MVDQLQTRLQSRHRSGFKSSEHVLNEAIERPYGFADEALNLRVTSDLTQLQVWASERASTVSHLVCLDKPWSDRDAFDAIHLLVHPTPMTSNKLSNEPEASSHAMLTPDPGLETRTSLHLSLSSGSLDLSSMFSRSLFAVCFKLTQQL